MTKPIPKVIALILFLLSVVSPWTTLAANWTPGVTRGDYFCYEMYGVFKSEDPDESISVSAFEQNITDKVRIDIIDVSGSVVNQIYTLYMGNKTEKFGFRTDLNPKNARETSYPERGVPICEANLYQGDYISTIEMTVNDTLIRTYPSGDRETNHVSWNTALDYGDCYFDRKTGVLVDLNRTHLYINPNTNSVIAKVDILKMTDSSFWSGSKSLSQVQLSIVAVATLGFAGVSSFYYRKRTKTKSEGSGPAKSTT